MYGKGVPGHRRALEHVDFSSLIADDTDGKQGEYDDDHKFLDSIIKFSPMGTITAPSSSTSNAENSGELIKNDIQEYFEASNVPVASAELETNGSKTTSEGYFPIAPSGPSTSVLKSTGSSLTTFEKHVVSTLKSSIVGEEDRMHEEVFMTDSLRLIIQDPKLSEIRSESLSIPPLEESSFDPLMHELNESGYRWHRFGLPFISSYTTGLQEKAYLSFPLSYLNSSFEQKVQTNLPFHRRSSGGMFSGKKTDTVSTFLSINISVNPAIAKGVTKQNSGKNREKSTTSQADEILIDLEYGNCDDAPVRKIGLKEIAFVEDHGNGSGFIFNLNSGEILLHGIYNQVDCKSIISLVQFLMRFTELNGHREVPEEVRRLLLCYHREQIYLNEKKVCAMLFSSRFLVFETNKRLPFLVVPIGTYTDAHLINTINYKPKSEEDPALFTDQFKLYIRLPSSTVRLGSANNVLSLSVSPSPYQSSTQGPGEYLFRTRLIFSAARWVAVIKYVCHSLSENLSREESPKSYRSKTPSCDEINKNLAEKLIFQKSPRTRSDSFRSVRRLSDGDIHMMSNPTIETKWNDDYILKKSPRISRNSDSLGLGVSLTLKLPLTDQHKFYNFVQANIRRIKIFASTNVLDYHEWLKLKKLLIRSKSSEKIVYAVLIRYQQIFENTWNFLKNSMIISEDPEDNFSAMQIIEFSHPGLGRETFSVGRFSVIRSWRLFRVDEQEKRVRRPHGERPYSPRSFNRTMKSVSIAKELMQTFPDIEQLYEQNRIEEAKQITEKAALGQLHDLRIASYVKKHYRELCSGLITEFTTRDILSTNKKEGNACLGNAEATSWQEKIFMFNPPISHVSRILAEPITSSVSHEFGYLFTHLNWLDMLRTCMVQRYNLLCELESAVHQYFLVRGEVKNSSKNASMAQLEAQVRFEKIELKNVLENLPDHATLKNEHQSAKYLITANLRQKARARVKGMKAIVLPPPEEKSPLKRCTRLPLQS